MGKLGSMIALAGFVSVLPAFAEDRAEQSRARPVAPQSISDPLKLIYRVSGVRDDGRGAELGVATAFHCTNWSNVAEKLAIWVYDWNATLVGAKGYTVESRRTVTISTHDTNVFDEDAVVSPGAGINQGSAQIAATTTNIYCSAMTVDATSTGPVGISLHLVRLNLFPGSTE